MKCSVCGSDNLEGSAYCEDCGARLTVGAAVATPGGGGQPSYTPPPPPPPAPPPEPHVESSQAVVGAAPPPEEAGTVVCSACGAANPAHEAYCEDCGASLSAARPAAAAPAPEAAPPPATAAPPGAMRPRLVLADTGNEVLLEKDEVLIGRRSPLDGIFPEVDLTDVDTESYVSRRHGRIVRQDSQFFYEDLGSSNGSFHNGTRLQRGVQASLHDGDRLKLGKTELVFRIF